MILQLVKSGGTSIYVLQVPREFLPYHLFSTCLYFTLHVNTHVLVL